MTEDHPEPSAHQSEVDQASLSVQDIAIRLTGGISAAYTAYDNGNNKTPIIEGYTFIKPIYVYETYPDFWPWSAHTSEISNRQRIILEKAYNSFQDLSSADKSLLGRPKPGDQLFGFTAIDYAKTHFMLALRGTVTLYEAYVDLFSWGDNTQCLLPSQPGNKNAYGQVNRLLFNFYSGRDDARNYSLADKCMEAIRDSAKSYPVELPWLVGGHSLGGAMASLVALDGVVSGVFPKKYPNPDVMTFGSLHVGEASFASNYSARVRNSYRMANLCDFVPAIVSLQPEIPETRYVHVGNPLTFVWQTWDGWHNHSLDNIYRPVVRNYWHVVKSGSRNYPQ